VASVSTLRELLEPTSLPDELVEEVLSDTNTLWLLGASDELVAGEMVLCHPALGPGEVRAVVNQTGQVGRWRVTVVTRDRAGLLAGTSAILAAHGLTIVDAAVTVLPRSRLGLQRLTVAAGGSGSRPLDWSELGRHLRDGLADGVAPSSSFVPRPPVVVEAHPQGLGRSVVTIEAPDGVGLLHAAAAWLADAGCNVEAGRATAEKGRARSVFIVAGPVDTEGLAAALGGVERRSMFTQVATTPYHVVAGLVDGGLRLATGALDRLPTGCWRPGGRA
jgi:predicted amino acid-binding ACT domain protein